MQNKENYNSIHWNDFLNSFLNLTELACAEIESPEHNEPTYLHTKIAIIYNIKHAIEIFMKTLIRIIDQNTTTKITSHNLNELFTILKSKIEQDLTQKINKQKESSKFIIQEFKKFDEYTTNIQEITNYYFQLEFLNKDDITILDTKNTAFKYPENKKQINVEINYFGFLYGKKFDTKKILKDIRSLRRYFNSIKTIINHMKYDIK